VTATSADPAPSAGTVLAAADQYRAEFEPNSLSAAPTRRLVVVTCMDARLDLFRLLGLHIGDSHIVRNAGGRVTEDVVRSLVLSSHMLGTREVLVIHHTGCGLHGVTNTEIRDRVEGATGADASSIDFLPFDDVRRSVECDVAAVRACPLLPRDLVARGAVYDVATGTLTRVR
jgi:carbonic anhydrase